MFIWIEGIDRTGKSELTEALALELGRSAPCYVKHFSAPKADTAIEEYLSDPQILGYDGTYHVVLDRFHLGEQVWPSYFGRESKMDVAERQLIELYLHEIGAVGVLTAREQREHQAAYEASVPPEPLPWRAVASAEEEFQDALDECFCFTTFYFHDEKLRDQLRGAITEHGEREARRFRKGILENTNGYAKEAVRNVLRNR